MRLCHIGNTCQFTGYAFLKALGRSTGAGDYEWRLQLTLDANIVKLHGWNDWTAIDWEQRQALRGKEYRDVR